MAELSRITTLHPRTYNEARTVGENFRDGTPVIMNLSEMDDSDAKRLVDFAAGLVFATRGSIERITSKVFLLSPPNVSVAAEDKARIARAASSTRADPSASSDAAVSRCVRGWPTRHDRRVHAVWSLIHLALWIFIALMWIRFVVDWVQVFARNWSPTGFLLVVLEIVYSATDPPIKALRRVIPPLRIGTVAIDLSFIIVMIVAYMLLSIVGGFL